MFFINKLRSKFQNLIRFEKLSPSNNHDFDDLFEGVNPKNNLNLFIKAINEHEELKEVIWIALYHCLNTFDVSHEYLTVLNKNFQLIADLVEGDDRSVELPVNVKNEMLNDNVLATFHNHFNGAILPSSNDLKNTIIPFVKFMVITSNENIGIIVNDLIDIDENLIEHFKQEWIIFVSYLAWSFNNNMTDDIEKIYNSKCSENDKQNKEQKLFDRYIGENSQKFIEEFNSRMEKYNVYFIQINIKER